MMHLQQSSWHLQASLAVEGWPVPCLSHCQKTRLKIKWGMPGLSLLPEFYLPVTLYWVRAVPELVLLLV